MQYQFVFDEQFDSRAYASQGIVNSHPTPDAPSFAPSHPGYRPSNDVNTLMEPYPYPYLASQPTNYALGFWQLTPQSTGLQAPVQTQYPDHHTGLTFPWTPSAAKNEATTTDKSLSAPQPSQGVQSSAQEGLPKSTSSTRTTRKKKTRSSLQKQRKQPNPATKPPKFVYCDCGARMKDWQLGRHRAYGSCPNRVKKDVICPGCLTSFARVDSLTRHKRNPEKCMENRVRKGLDLQSFSTSSTTFASQTPPTALGTTTTQPSLSSSSSSSSSASSVAPLNPSSSDPFMTETSSTSPFSSLEQSPEPVVLARASDGSSLRPASPSFYVSYPPLSSPPAPVYSPPPSTYLTYPASDQSQTNGLGLGLGLGLDEHFLSHTDAALGTDSGYSGYSSSSSSSSSSPPGCGSSSGSSSTSGSGALNFEFEFDFDFDGITTTNDNPLNTLNFEHLGNTSTNSFNTGLSGFRF